MKSPKRVVAAAAATASRGPEIKKSGARQPVGAATTANVKSSGYGPSAYKRVAVAQTGEKNARNMMSYQSARQ